MTFAHVPDVAGTEATAAGFAEARHSAVFRVFTPLEVAGGDTVTWGHVADSAGYDLAPETTWKDLAHCLGSREASRYRPASGTCDSRSLRTLLDILTDVVPGLQASTEVTFAMWPGYAGEVTDVGSVKVYGDDAPLPFGRYGGLATAQAPLDRLLTFGYENPGRPHMPVYVCPPDGAFLVSCPIYANSLVVSGDERLVVALDDSATDAVRVGRDSPLNSRDDLD